MSVAAVGLAVRAGRHLATMLVLLCAEADR
jgi:hypothetical protein